MQLVTGASLSNLHKKGLGVAKQKIRERTLSLNFDAKIVCAHSKRLSLYLCKGNVWCALSAEKRRQADYAFFADCSDLRHVSVAESGYEGDDGVNRKVNELHRRASIIDDLLQREGDRLKLTRNPLEIAFR